jgi:hypothetical protein
MSCFDLSVRRLAIWSVAIGGKCTTILKAKYFPNSSILEDKPKQACLIPGAVSYMGLRSWRKEWSGG